MEIKNTLPPRFSFTAPGKVILHGEHSVVYGHGAIAASVNLTTKVDYELLDASKPDHKFIHIILPKVNVDITLSEKEFNDLLLVDCQSLWDYTSPQNTDFENLVKHVQNYMMSQPKLQDLNNQQQIAMKSCLFLMAAILKHSSHGELATLKPFSMCVTSDLPVGAGAGSSASYCVCLASLFVCLASFRAVQTFCLDDKMKDMISNWAFMGEKITHGNPSGLDNSICTFGALISFRRAEPNVIQKIPLHSGLRVLLVDTKVSRNTRVLIDKVVKLRAHHGSTVDAIMQAMDCICNEATGLFELLDEAKRKNSEQEAEELFARMEELWSMNHSLLCTLGVSHPSLERIIQISKEHNLCGKLTGAGGGGFAIVLAPRSSAGNFTALAPIKESLAKSGFDVKDVELGGPGVQLHLI